MLEPCRVPLLLSSVVVNGRQVMRKEACWIIHRTQPPDCSTQWNAPTADVQDASLWSDFSLEVQLSSEIQRRRHELPSRPCVPTLPAHSLHWRSRYRRNVAAKSKTFQYNIKKPFGYPQLAGKTFLLKCLKKKKTETSREKHLWHFWKHWCSKFSRCITSVDCCLKMHFILLQLLHGVELLLHNEIVWNGDALVDFIRATKKAAVTFGNSWSRMTGSHLKNEKEGFYFLEKLRWISHTKYLYENREPFQNPHAAAGVQTGYVCREAESVKLHKSALSVVCSNWIYWTKIQG